MFIHIIHFCLVCKEQQNKILLHNLIFVSFVKERFNINSLHNWMTAYISTSTRTAVHQVYGGCEPTHCSTTGLTQLQDPPPMNGQTSLNEEKTSKPQRTTEFVSYAYAFTSNVLIRVNSSVNLRNDLKAVLSPSCSCIGGF